VLPVDDYPNPSKFDLPNDSISAIDVGTNVRAILYEHVNFGGRQAYYEGGFYYDSIGNVNDKTSSIKIFLKQGGPAATHYRGDFPSASESFWAENAQGLANDGANWFVAKRTRIFRVPLSYSLANHSSSGLDTTAMPPILQHVYNHFGDPDQNSGYLFVPLECTNDDNECTDKSVTPSIGVFSTIDLRFLSSTKLSDIENAPPEMKSAPWVAIRSDGYRGTLWTSSSNLTESNQLREYDIDWDRLGASGQLLLTFRRQVTLQDQHGKPMDLTLMKSMQGGVFNPDGTLLYTSSGPCDSHGYVHVFAVGDTTDKRAPLTARLQARSENGYGPFDFETHPEETCFTFPPFYQRCFCSRDEGEGLDWLDVRGLNAPWIPDSQLHVIMNDNDADTDNVYLKHYSY
jgi:hypothetical protein